MANLITTCLTHLLVVVFVGFYPLICTLSVLSLLYRRYFQKPKWNIEKGDVAVVTGAGHGLGKAYAEYLAKRGCTICVVDINGRLAEEVAAELKQLYKVKAISYVTDVGNFEEVEKLHKKIKRDFGNTSILINNAGVLLLSSMLDPIPEEMQNMVNVNLTAHMWTTKVFLPDMMEQNRGHILAVASISGLLVIPFNGVYSCTKYAVKGFMRSLRQSLNILNYSNITCTTVFPFFLSTNEYVVKMVTFMKLAQFHPILDAETIVDSSMEALLRGECEVTIPRIFAGIYKLLEMLPAESSDFILNTLNKMFVSTDRIQKFEESFFKSN